LIIKALQALEWQSKNIGKNIPSEIQGNLRRFWDASGRQFRVWNVTFR